MDIVRWMNPTYSSRQRIPSMECHCSQLVYNHYLAVVCGWGNSMRNSVMLFDLTDTPTLSPVRCVTSAPPEFRYGFSLSEYENKLYLLGGFRGGGYSHSTSGFYQIDLSIADEEAMATYSPMESSSRMTERGFHSACVATINMKPTLIIWGGLHDNVAVGALELFDFESKTWRQGKSNYHLIKTDVVLMFVR